MTGVGPDSADRHCPSNTVDDVVATGWRADRLRQERKLLGEDLLGRPVTREEAVAHHERLLPVPDHPALRGPVVVSLDLLGRACGGHERQGREHDRKAADHGVG